MVTGGIIGEIDPSRIYSLVSEHKEMRARLGWAIPYKSLLGPLLTGMRERSLETEEGTEAIKLYSLFIQNISPILIS